MIRHRSIMSIVLTVFGLALQAQPAPDFNVTDSWGSTHRLYEDYLDQGTTVVIKVFYVACPPCNEIAPYLETLYQSWGGGQADVQFIELSILQSDSDALINGYKSNHSTTYPAAGGQGGSVAAVDPYTNGMFGLYNGTPTFVVIAPDGAINYDVFGFNFQGTIDAIDAAIAATGAQGLNTAIAEAEKSLPVNLGSNLVYDNLTLNILGEVASVTISFVNILGQTGLSSRHDVMSGEAIQLDISSLTAGLWICRIEGDQHRRVASYLLIKQ